MTHFVCFPSARIDMAYSCAKEWEQKGYIPLVMLDPPTRAVLFAPCTVIEGPSPFPGYYQVINQIARSAFLFGADVCTFIGDDMTPPKQGAEEHTLRYFARFPDGYGMMQCTGDRQGEKIGGKVNSERICGSPTFGRGWHEKAFGGTGGFPTAFSSFYADEVLKEVAERLGLLYQEPDLTIDHLHWSFGRSVRQPYHERAEKNWQQDQAVFMKYKAEDFSTMLATFPGVSNKC